MSEPRFTIAYDGHVATVTLAGPKGKAVMDARFFTELADTVTALDANDDVRVIVLAGSGGHFSFGLDLMEAVGTFAQNSAATDSGGRQALHAMIRQWQAALDVVAKTGKPTIAAVTGWCIGGGVDLAVACDVRIAS